MESLMDILICSICFFEGYGMEFCGACREFRNLDSEMEMKEKFIRRMVIWRFQKLLAYIELDPGLSPILKEIYSRRIVKLISEKKQIT